jgi:hypothetical protein
VPAWAATKDFLGRVQRVTVQYQVRKAITTIALAVFMLLVWTHVLACLNFINSHIASDCRCERLAT